MFSFEKLGQKLDSKITRMCKLVRIQYKRTERIICKGSWYEMLKNNVIKVSLVMFLIGLCLPGKGGGLQILKSSKIPSAYAEETVTLPARTSPGSADVADVPGVTEENLENPAVTQFLKELEQIDAVPTLRKVDKEAVQLAQQYDAAKEAPAPYLEPNNGRINFHFGSMTPRVVCRPLRMTDVELEPGEQVTGFEIGDPARWTVSSSTSGTIDNLVTHVIIKPVLPKISTNMFIHTNKRTYMLELVSIASGQYMPFIGFIYSDVPATVSAADKQSWKDLKQKYAVVQQKQAEKKEENLRQQQTQEKLSNVNRGYAIKVTKGKTPAWMPKKVYDVGGKTYIQLDKNIQITEAPVLYAIRDAKEKLINYRVYKNWYIADCIFDKGIMRIGGSIVTITRKAPITADSSRKKRATAATEE